MEQTTKENSEESKKLKQYKKRSGVDDGSGPTFEKQMIALLFIRYLQNFNKVILASNAYGAGKFDDIVITDGETTTVCIQLKAKTKKICENYLTKPSSDLCSLMYYKSYSELKKTWNESNDLQEHFKFENAIFVLYTNAKFEYKMKSKTNAKLNAQWQEVLNTGGEIISFSDCKNTFPKVFEMYEDLSKSLKLQNVKNRNNNVTLEQPQREKMGPRDKKCLNKILNGLDDFNYEEFLSKFWLFTNQAKEEDLDALIQKDLGELLCVSGDCLRECYLEFHKAIKCWWQNRKGVVITEQSEFWKKITNICVDRLKNESLKGLNIDFLKFNANELKTFVNIASTSAIIASDSAELTALKVCQSFKEQTCLLVNTSILLKHEKEVLNLWKRWYDVLTVMMPNEDTTFDIKSMLSVINTNPWKRLLLVGCVSQQIINKLEIETKTLCKSEDNCNILQLDSKSYERVQRLTLNLQDHEVAINQLVPDQHLSGAILLQLLSDEKVRLGPHLKEMIRYLIPCTLQRMDVIDKKILSSPAKNDYFIIGNTEELQRFVPVGNKVCIYRRDEFNCTSRFIQVGEDFTVKDFDNLCVAHSSKSFHWLNVNTNEKLIWQRSSKKVDLILNHLQSGTLYEAKDKIHDRLVTVIAEPGMGKTVLLSSIALHTKTLKPNSWLINVNLNNHAEYLSREDSTAVGLLQLSAGIDSTFEKKIFQVALYFTENVTVLLDGFDEISPGNSDKVLDFVHYLLSDTRVNQIWLSSRPTMKYILWKKLGYPFYEIVPFSKTEKRLFLKKYWGICDVENFIGKLLDLLEKHTNDLLGKFTGIPLQLKMLAEVFKEDMECYKTTGCYQLPSTLDLYKLYNMFVETKWKIYLTEKTRADLTNEAQKTNCSKLKKMFIQQHESCALFTLLTPVEFSWLPGADEMMAFKEEERGERPGIITEWIDGQPVFIHRTFQEYFAAHWLSNNFAKVPFLLNNKIRHNDFELVLRFFDRMLVQGCSLHIAVMNLEPDLVENLIQQNPALIRSTDKGGRSVLHAAVLAFNYKLDNDLKGKVYKILEIILRAGVDLNVSDKVLCWRAMRYADIIKAWKVIDSLLHRGADPADLISVNTIGSQPRVTTEIEEFDVHPLAEVLLEAIGRGFTALLEYFISSEALLEERIMPRSISFHRYSWLTEVTLLQECCFWGITDLVQLLLNKGASVDSGDTKYNMTALMWAAMKGHTDIITLLLERGANCNAQSKFYQIMLMHEKSVFTTDLVTRMNYFLDFTHGDKGHTALLIAAQFGHTEVVRVLLEHGADVNVEDESGQTPLLFAAEFGYLGIAEQLLNHGAQVNKVNAWGLTPLHLSIRKCHLSVTKCLISNGADIHMVEMHRYTTLHLAAIYNEGVIQYLLNLGLSLYTTDARGNAPIHVAAEEGNLKAVKKLVRNGVSVTQSNTRGRTPLHLASSNGHLELVKWLIQHGTFIYDEDVDGNTPLHLVPLSEQNTVEIALHLIKKGAVLNQVNKNRKSPLHFAVNSNNLDLAILMLKHGACINDCDDDGLTPLHIAARQGYLDLVKLLVKEQGAVNECCNDGKTSLYYSVSSGKVCITEYLINNGANVNKGDVLNKSPLHVALENGYLKLAELLVNCGAEVNSVTDEGQTALHVASELGQLNIIKMLVTAGSSVNQENKYGVTAVHLAVKDFKIMEYLTTCGADIKLRTANGCTALHSAAESGSLDVTQWLVTSGLTLDSTTNDGRTPLHFALARRNVEVIDWIIQENSDMGLTQYAKELLDYAVYRGNLELFHKIVEKNGDIQKKSSKGETILHRAACRGHLEFVEALIDLGLNMNQRCYDGRTPLHFAAEKGKLKVVEWLVSHGSEPMLRTNDGTTAAHLAARGGHQHIVLLLEKHGADLHDVNYAGQTLMHFAAQGGKLEMIQWLKSKSVNLYAKSNDGRSLIHYIAPVLDIRKVEHLECLKVNFYDKTRDGATVMHYVVQQKNYKSNRLMHWLWTRGLSSHVECSDGKTCIHFAAFADNVWWLEWSLEYHNINLETPCADGRAPVHFAAQGGAINVLQLLKSKDCNLLQQTNDGRTALHFAALEGNISVIQWLLQEGADVHETDNKGRKAEDFALIGGHNEVSTWLKEIMSQEGTSCRN